MVGPIAKVIAATQTLEVAVVDCMTLPFSATPTTEWNKLLLVDTYIVAHSSRPSIKVSIFMLTFRNGTYRT